MRRSKRNPVVVYKPPRRGPHYALRPLRNDLAARELHRVDRHLNWLRWEELSELAKDEYRREAGKQQPRKRVTLK